MEKLNWTHAGGHPVQADSGGVRALTVSDIGVVFQPIVDMQTGTTFAHEALVRCKVPEFASPLVLFERAVEESSCGRLGRIIREVAFGTCGDVPLFVNLHPEELSSRWLVRPDDPLCMHSAPVFLEITESAAFTHFDLCRSVLKELCRRTGAILVIDDFGAGYSNLQRLLDLEPAIVKLDLMLIRDLDKYPRKRAVVRHVVNLCKELGARVVAEGIETLDELTCVRDLGVDYAQGYLLARPAMPPPTVVWPLADSSSKPLLPSMPRRLPVPMSVPVPARGTPRPLPGPAPGAGKPPPALRPPVPRRRPPSKPSARPASSAAPGHPRGIPPVPRP
jgi:EAL domain-containing protein (putative c-di-GMP-specific phosphodiesterase class I)